MRSIHGAIGALPRGGGPRGDRACKPTTAAQVSSKEEAQAGSRRPQVGAYLAGAMAACCLSTFFTIFCSSIKKARTMRWRTHWPHREPPYARDTFFCRLLMRWYSDGRSAGICAHEKMRRARR
jgi:hypothetical protein